MRWIPLLKIGAWGVALAAGLPLLLRAIEGQEAQSAMVPYGRVAQKVQCDVGIPLTMNASLSEEAGEPPPPPPPPGPGVPGGVAGGVIGGVVGGTGKALDIEGESRLVRTGEMVLEVQDVPKAKEEAVRRIAAVKGWVAEQGEERDEDGHLKAHLSLRLPSSAFEVGKRSLRDLGTLRREQLQSEDVSRQWVDREARLQVKRAAAGRLRQLLAKRTASLKELLEAEKELVRVTEEIESLEAVHRLQARKVAFATLDLQLWGPRPQLTHESLNPLARLGSQVVTRLSASLAVLILLVTGLVPWLLGAGAGWLGFRRWRRAHPKEVAHEAPL